VYGGIGGVVLIRKKYRAILLGILSGVIAILYFTLFFQKGILFENSFLKSSKGINGFAYTGTAYGEHIQVITKGDIRHSNTASITYSVGDWLKKTYIVNVLSSTEVSSEVTIYENNNLQFEGTYSPNSNLGFVLLDKEGELVWDFSVSYNNQGPFNEGYNVSKSHIIATAFQNNIIVRGNGGLLLVAILLILFTAIDIKWPLFFFHLRYMLSVNNPEPSDLYIALQRISWYAYSVITIGLLIASLLVH